MNSYNSYDESELLRLLKDGDHAAFTEIYKRYHKAVYSYLLGFAKDPLFTEDLLHDVFIKLWEIRERLKIEASFSAYLFRICHNKAISALRKIATDDKSRNNMLKHLIAVQTSADLSNASDLKHYDQLFEKALASLPLQRRKVFVLCRQEGKSYDEVAAELGISRNTVKEHMVNAVKSLRAFLSDNGEIVFSLVVLEILF